MDLNVVADHNGFDVFPLVVRHLDAFHLVISDLLATFSTNQLTQSRLGFDIASRITFPHFGISASMRAANSSGVFATGSKPRPFVASRRAALRAFRKWGRDPLGQPLEPRPVPGLFL